MFIGQRQLPIKAPKVRKRERGTSALEFSLILPMFLLVLVGVGELGRAVWIYSTVAHAAREGTRYAMVRGAENKAPVTAQEIESYVQAQAGYGSSTAVNTTWQPDNKPGSIVQVSVQYDFQSIASILPIGPLPLRSTSRMIVAH